MSRYKVWKTGAGAVEVHVKSLAPFVMSPLLRLMMPGPDIDLPFTNTGPHWVRPLTAHEVATLRSAPTSDNPPSLLFACGAAKSPGAPSNNWGWGMRVTRGGTILPAFDDQGAALTLDADGFVRTALRQFAAGKSVAMGFDIISFS